MDSLYQRSIDIILENQAPGGAYLASPSFPNYRYCWFRDGSYTAYAMDLAGQAGSSARFHRWAAERVNERASVVRTAIEKWTAGRQLTDADILHTRYQPGGADAEAAGWGNFQLDGFGTWLWALNEHRTHNPGATLPERVLEAAGLVADYLSALWPAACFDCWEEHPEHVHPYTLAAIYGGLRGYAELSGRDYQPVITDVRQAVLDRAKEFGRFVKSPGSPDIDSSALGIAVPYGVVAPDDPLMLRTVEQIEATLLRAGGLHRYAADTYYGGGAWILLSGWLAWYYTEMIALQPNHAAASAAKVGELAAWIRLRAGRNLELPEQVAEHLNSPDDYPAWIKRWGPVASPLLWSHAEYIILSSRLDALGLSL